MKAKTWFSASECSDSGRQGFTRLELLVIIGLLALLATIQVSAHAGAKWRTREAMCASNVRKLTMVLHLYGNDNENKLPVMSGNAAWAWDMPTNVADDLISYGLHKRDFYCPSTAPEFTDWENFLDPAPGHNLWDWGPTFHIVGYILAISGPASRLSSTNQNATLLAEPRKGSPFAFYPPQPPPPNSERELVADVIISAPGQNNATLRLTGTYNYDNILGGYYRLNISSHLNGHLPQGSNIGYKDGHVAWRKFSDSRMAPRTVSGATFWW